MHDVGAKFARGLEHPRVVPHEHQIKTQMQVDVERKRSAIQFQDSTDPSRQWRVCSPA